MILVTRLQPLEEHATADSNTFTLCDTDIYTDRDDNDTSIDTIVRWDKTTKVMIVAGLMYIAAVAISQFISDRFKLASIIVALCCATIYLFFACCMIWAREGTS